MKEKIKKQNKKRQEECPLCQVSEETLKRLKEKTPNKESEKKPIQKKKGLWQKLVKK